MFKLKHCSVLITTTMTVQWTSCSTQGILHKHFTTQVPGTFFNWALDADRWKLSWAFSLKTSRAPQSDLKRLLGCSKCFWRHIAPSPSSYSFLYGHGRAKASWSLQKQPKARIPCRNHTSYVNTGNVASYRTQIYHVTLQLMQCNC